MEVKIDENKAYIAVCIECPSVTPEVLRLKEHILLFEGTLWARTDDRKHKILLSDILYFETLDNKTFLYTANDVLEISQRLCVLESALTDRGFLRCSKSILINLNQIVSLQPEINRSILATMSGGDRVTISRRYVKSLLNKLEF